MTIISLTFLAVSSVASVAQAVPNVTPVKAAAGCDVYPADAWTIQVDQCTNSTSEEPCSIDGFHNGVQELNQEGDDWDGYSATQQGFISIVADDTLPKTQMHCSVGSRDVVIITVDAPEHGTPSLGVYDIDGETIIGYGGPEPINPPLAYSHVDEAGEELEGLFLGYDDITTWAVKYHESHPNSLSGDPYWSIRLLAAEGGLEEGESAAFLKVTAPSSN